MTYFLKSGTIFRVTTKDAMDLHEALPAGNYVVKWDDNSGQFFLEAIENFDIKGKLYGDTIKHTKRILSTFDNRPASTGVMLNGEKGSGKTLLAKNVAFEAAKSGIPTIVINAPWHGDKFNAFVQMIQQACIILFDEFEKTYDKVQQEAILTLLDGVFPSKKLFIITCNDKWRVDEHMRNRPGRIFYMLDFKGLNENFIREYCADNLDQKEHIDQICSISSLFEQFNFDMLKALVEEMNRYKESPQESMAMLNAKPEFSGRQKFKVVLKINNSIIPEADLQDDTMYTSPLKEGVHVEYRVSDGDGDWDWKSSSFKMSDLVSIDNGGSRYVYLNEAKNSLELTKIEDKNFDYWKAF